MSGMVLSNKFVRLTFALISGSYNSNIDVPVYAIQCKSHLRLGLIIYKVEPVIDAIICCFYVIETQPDQCIVSIRRCVPTILISACLLCCALANATNG